MENTPWHYPPYHPLSVFRYIHRRLPLLIVSDMVLGVAIGGIFHQEAVGALAGFVFSFVNYFYLGRTIFSFLVR